MTYPIQTKVKTILKEYGFAPNKKLGQNFLIDKAMARKILAALDLGSEDTVLEIGSGLGALTWLIAPQVKQLISIEFDAGYIRYLQRECRESNFHNVQIVHGDILKQDWNMLCYGQKVKVVGNLPYSITGPSLMQLMEERTKVEQAVVMLQAEVVEKMIAPVNGRDYNRLSVYCSLLADVQRVSLVPRQCYYPEPKVDSAVLKLTFKKDDPLRGDLWPLFQRILNIVFQKRRKMIQGSLKGFEYEGRVISSEEWGFLFDRAGVSGTMRPQELSAENFLRLVKEVSKLLT